MYKDILRRKGREEKEAKERCKEVKRRKEAMRNREEW